MTDSERKTDTKNTIPTVSDVFEDRTIVELIYRPELRQTTFAMFNAGRWTFQDHVDTPERGRLVPFSPNNNLIKNEVVLLPSEPRMYGNEQQLLSEIAAFIHRYADLSSVFEHV